ncbi:MAG: ImmA/IrrE family metallo-endopeptidase [Planctomycetes bacterium]|nr:ImmA/IrrE family metallo-endopeptidase [Planctomycetota bacterium]MBL7041847.1 ImmA/IrrE family metallo-endopeptidase [Pirellulaceae bacterium]
MTKIYTFEPDYIVPPGATLKETLEAKGMSQADLALRLGLAEKTVSQIINGIAPISFETAEKLELVTGVPANFWNQRELTYREGLAKRQAAERHRADIGWLREIPVKELVARGFMKEAAEDAVMVRSSLAFFGAGSVDSWRNAWAAPDALYRGKLAQEKHPGYVATWLRIGELQADGVECEPFDAREFRKALNDLRELTIHRAKVWRQQMGELCRAAGVAVVFTKEIPRASVSGATRWLTKDKALLQLSLKHKTDDQLWFTFFHEAGHILLHGKKQVFLEFGATDKTEEEREANRFAQDILIPPAVANRLPYLKSKAQILQFSSEINRAPGIVVGRLQREKLLPPSHCNNLKAKLAWAATK